MVLPLAKSYVEQIKKDLMAQAISPVEKHVESKCSSSIHNRLLLHVHFIPETHFSPFRMLNCKAHQCQQVCHRAQCQPCPRSPSLMKMCPCGQTLLTKLLELGYSERSSCSDPIPSCGKTCNKPLACGSSGKEECVRVVREQQIELQCVFIK